jgi:molybdenum cofactor synthesis domain-containing protein
MICVGILTISDKGFKGQREDISGREIKKMIEILPAKLALYEIIPDDKDVIKNKLIDFADKKGLDLIITTGGTGVSPRDVTPDATLEIIEKEVPGMAEAMRQESLKKTPHAMISRAVVGIRKNSLIINLPGSPQGARENLLVVLPALPHALSKIKGDTSECADLNKLKLNMNDEKDNY